MTKIIENPKTNKSPFDNTIVCILNFDVDWPMTSS